MPPCCYIRSREYPIWVLLVHSYWRFFWPDSEINQIPKSSLLGPWQTDDSALSHSLTYWPDCRPSLGRSDKIYVWYRWAGCEFSIGVDKVGNKKCKGIGEKEIKISKFLSLFIWPLNFLSWRQADHVALYLANRASGSEAQITNFIFCDMCYSQDIQSLITGGPVCFASSTTYKMSDKGSSMFPFLGDL